MESIGLILILLLLLLGFLFIRALSAGSEIKSLRDRMERLETRATTVIRDLSRRLSLAEEALARQAIPERPSVGPLPQEVPPPIILQEQAPEPVLQEQAPEPLPIRPAARTSPPPVVKTDDSLAERNFAERWLVWLGGIALALGGAFLVKFSIDQELLGPAVRVTLSALIGAAIIGGGHWLSRRELAKNTTPGYVPSAMVGGGAFIIFASIYAGYALYALFPLPVVFVALVATAAGTVVLSLWHGPFVALLGVIGAFAVPLLVRSGSNNVGVFGYLFLLSAAALALLRWREWWWLAWAILVGTVGWVGLWLVAAWQPGNELALGLFLCGLFGLFVLFRRGIPTIRALSGVAQAPMVEGVVSIAALVVAVMTIPVMARADFSWVSLAVPLVLSLGFIIFGRGDPTFDRLPWVGAVLAVLTLFVWRVDFGALDHARGVFFQPFPEEMERFISVLVAFVAVFFAAGFLFLGRTVRPIRWASLAAATPAALLAVAYWRLSPLGEIWPWASAALVIAAILLVAAERTVHHRSRPGFEGVLAAYAIGVIAALTLCFTFAFKEAWLSVSLAVLPLGIAWVNERVRVVGMRPVALLLASVVLVRLALNPYVLSYPIGETAAFNGLLYGYGLPALAFFFAAWKFRRSEDDLLVSALEAGSIVFTVLLVSFEIRHFMTGSFAVENGYAEVERSLHTISWLSIAAALFYIHRRSGRSIPLYGGYILLGLATAQLVLLQVLFGNPLFTGVPVGGTVILNQLLLLFAAPAILYVLHRWIAPDWPSWLRWGSGALALLLTVLWSSLQIRHLFVGGETGSIGIEQGYTLVERGVHTLSWLSLAAGLFFLHRQRKNFTVALYGGLGLLGLASVQLLFLQVLNGNPLLTDTPISMTLIFNVLLLLFAVPALLYALHSRIAPNPPPWLRLACGAAALVLAFLWASLEIRHAFAGAILAEGRVGQVEMWMYSVLYLLGSLGMLMGGIASGNVTLRRAGLAVLLGVVVKVFLVDLSHTGGIWRALSFFGLGAGLMGVGLLYRRLGKIEGGKTEGGKTDGSVVGPEGLEPPTRPL